jgi:hypothetical protein
MMTVYIYQAYMSFTVISHLCILDAAL